MANITNGFSSHHGVEVLRNPRTNKGLAFSLEERKALGIDGLLPPVVQTQDEQAALALVHMKDCKSDLDRYIYLMELATRNEKLFYRVLIENIMEMMPIVYTPVVGLACQNYGLILRNSQGLYISINDAGHIFEKLGNWPEPNVKAICVTDGERILGLGDLGTYGMGIPVGKLCLYTACAGIAPDMCLPITLDVGTNTEVLLKDPLYTGLRQKRVTGDKYFDFLEEFMTSVVKRYGEHILIQFEDFGNHNAFQLINKYRDRFCTFNDDIQG
jgi:malate dehydrogenase (oxaloacetate-decarboxylating)(NADP+)